MCGTPICALCGSLISDEFVFEYDGICYCGWCANINWFTVAHFIECKIEDDLDYIYNNEGDHYDGL